ncbi:MAG: sulfate adenylyltransferase, partial [Chlamydiota bacterium]|nr:sulfate adenylyltransferase [Chlamydiota bacterium]
MDLIHPHGELLINRFVEDSKKEATLKKASTLVKIPLDDKNISDLEMIACGAMSPLSGFMTEKDYRSVVENMRLSNGLVWPIPVTLAVNDELKMSIEGEKQAALVDHEEHILAILNIEDIFQYDKKEEAQKVYLTEDPNHPGVAYVYQQGEYCVGGSIDMIASPNHEDFLPYRLSPRQTRDAFKERGWSSVVAFQTRNPIHRAHEYLQKCA